MRGIFYSLVVMIFIIPIVLFAVSYLNSVQSAGGVLEAKAVGDKLISYATSINYDFPHATGIISSNAVQTAFTHVDVTGQPLDNATFRLKEIMQHGSLYGNATNQNFTFDSWVFQIRQKGSLYGFNTDVQLVNISIMPSDSYGLNASAVIFVNVSDKSGTIAFERFYTATIRIPINEFADPLYTLKTNGLIKRTIAPPNMAISGVQSLDDAAAERFYMSSSSGPSFLDRLEGRLTLSQSYQSLGNVGLETIVNTPELQANGLTVDTTQSVIDYLYFASASSGCLVNGTSYNWLKLDSAHASIYNVSTAC